MYITVILSINQYLRFLRIISFESELIGKLFLVKFYIFKSIFKRPIMFEMETKH